MIGQTIVNITINHIRNRYGNNLSYANSILQALRQLLPSSSYCFPTELFGESLFPETKDDGFQELLAKVNEKEDRRKKEGVYYTDRDATDFLAANTLIHYCCSNETKVIGVDKALKRIDSLTNAQKLSIVKATVMDPTCGTGEFLLSVLLLLHQEVFSTLDRLVAGGHPPPVYRREKDRGHPIFVFLRTKEVLGDERNAILVSFAIPRQSFCRPLPFPILWSLGKV